MTILLLCLLFVGPVTIIPIVLARRRGGVLSQRALAVAAVGGLDLKDVLSYTRDCSHAACLLLAHRGVAPTLARRYVVDAVTQLDSVQRAARLRAALSHRWRALPEAWPSWPDLLLWLAGLLDAETLARIIVWRRGAGVADLEGMTQQALGRFTAAMDDAAEAPFVNLFAEELVRLGLLDREDVSPNLARPHRPSGVPR